MLKASSIALSASLFLALLGGCQATDPGLEAPIPVATEDSPQVEAVANAFTFELGSSIGIEGVSPELIALPEGGYLLFVTGLGEDRVYRSDDAITFAPEPSVQVPMGSDYSLLQKPDGTWLLYYVMMEGEPGEPGEPGAPGEPMDPAMAKKAVMVSASQDLRTFAQGSSTGISQQTAGRAWGVPDTYIGPDGTYRMMWVDKAVGQNWEVLRTASSSDGLSFTADEDFVISDGYVDPFMMRAEEGDWLLLLSTTPGRLPQKIFVATSPDGITWDIPKSPLLEASDRNYLDPTAVETSEGVWQVILSTVPLADALSGPYEYVSGVFTETP